MIKICLSHLAIVPLAFLLSACNENSHDILPIKLPVIKSINTLDKLITGRTAVFVIVGENLTEKNIKIDSNGCNNLQIQLLSSSKINVSCQPSLYGKQTIIINNEQGKPLLNKVFSVDTAETNQLNDTGINFCTNDKNIFLNQCEQDDVGKWFVSVQDAAMGRDFLATKGQLRKQGRGNAGFDFSKVSVTGELLANNSKTWSCVLDHTTGLLWEVKTNDGGLHDVNHEYAWYNTDENNNGGQVGNINNNKNTDAFVKAVNKVGLCGHHDWYLPNAMQLQGILDYSKPFPKIDTNYFPHTQQDIYWSSSSTIDGLHAVSVDFNYGIINATAKNHRFSDTEHFVRLVRSATVIK